MDKASDLGLEKAGRGYRLVYGQGDGYLPSGHECLVVHESEGLPGASEQWIAAGLPSWLSTAGTVKPVNIFFTLVPNGATTRCGPFVQGGALRRVRNSIANEGLLDVRFAGEVGDVSAASTYKRKDRSQIVEKLFYTPFHPNKMVAEVIKDIGEQRDLWRIDTAEAKYSDLHSGYSKRAKEAEILPIVPINSSPTSLAKDIVDLTGIEDKSF